MLLNNWKRVLQHPSGSIVQVWGSCTKPFPCQATTSSFPQRGEGEVPAQAGWVSDGAVQRTPRRYTGGTPQPQPSISSSSLIPQRARHAGDQPLHDFSDLNSIELLPVAQGTIFPFSPNLSIYLAEPPSARSVYYSAPWPVLTQSQTNTFGLLHHQASIFSADF